MKKVNKFGLYITLLCSIPLNYGLVAQNSPVHEVGKAQCHHGNKQEHKVKQSGNEHQTLTFNFVLNFMVLSSNTIPTGFKPFVETPRVIVTTPDGRVFSKNVRNSFDIFNLNGSTAAPNLQTIQIVVKKPSTGTYTLSTDLPIENFNRISVDDTGTNVVASRDKSVVFFTFNQPSSQLAQIVGTTNSLTHFYTYGPASSHVPSP